MRLPKAFSSTVLLLCFALAAAGQAGKTSHVVLVTADGLRWQEVFRGANPEWFGREEMGTKGAEDLRARFDADTPDARRKRLMPFLWSEIIRRGVVFGNRDRGSEVVVRNRYRFSYPGYSEMLTGKPQDDVIDSNNNRPNPSPTVLEIVRQEFGLPREKVALFGSWAVFTGIGAHHPGSVFINAGYQAVVLAGASERLKRVSGDQFDLLTPWRSVRHDYSTFELALEYLRTVKPRLLHIALGETDDWAHEERYDRYLETARYFDQCLERLWETIQADPQYRNRTTLLASTDHGRGSTAEDWNSHGEDVEGAEFIWLAVMGPDTPAQGEAAAAGRLTQSDIAPTILELLGIDYRKLEGVTGQPFRKLGK